jgi:hypothetical protein
MKNFQQYRTAMTLLFVQLIQCHKYSQKIYKPSACPYFSFLFDIIFTQIALLCPHETSCYYSFLQMALKSILVNSYCLSTFPTTHKVTCNFFICYQRYREAVP